MQKPLAILDLDDLTQAHVDLAMQHPGSCSYLSPCIIGALMSEEERQALANITTDCGTEGDEASIESLVAEGFIAFVSPDQVNRAAKIQKTFDLIDLETPGSDGERESFERLQAALPNGIVVKPVPVIEETAA